MGGNNSDGAAVGPVMSDDPELEKFERSIRRRQRIGGGLSKGFNGSVMVGAVLVDLAMWGMVILGVLWVLKAVWGTL